MTKLEHICGAKGACPQVSHFGESGKKRRKKTMKFYKIDNQIVISDKELSVGEELAANTVDAAHEKHVPVIEVSGDTVNVKVGSVEHPNLDAHYIEWIVLQTERGIQMKWLKPGMKPEATFKVTDKPIAAFEYCNLHGLWKAEA